jgi:hypothetical protein
LITYFSHVQEIGRDTCSSVGFQIFFVFSEAVNHPYLLVDIVVGGCLERTNVYPASLNWPDVNESAHDSMVPKILLA